MSDLWRTLEERSANWNVISRQGLVDSVWLHYVTARFGRTGDPRALDYLYPYLAKAATRHQAVRVARDVFEGRGAQALETLTYFTQHPDSFLRDRAVRLVGAAVTGSGWELILQTLQPYLQSNNQFVRRQAVVALSQAARGQASDAVLREILEVAAETPAIGTNLRISAITLLYQGAPTEETYRLAVKPERDWERNIVDFEVDEDKVGHLVMGAEEVWFDRMYEDLLAHMLIPDEFPEEVGRGWMRPGRHKGAVEGLSTAGAGRGMKPFLRMLEVRQGHGAIHAMMRVAPRCFVGANLDDCLDPLSKLAVSGDVATQRVAAVCLGRLVMHQDREDTISLLADLCNAKNGAVRAAAVRGVGMAARSHSDESLRRICLRLADEPETSRAAIRALGTVYLGTGRSDVFGEIRDRAVALRNRPVRGKKHNKPLAACYFSAGLIYAGTGSLEPVEFLLDGMARPRESQHMAARGLVMTEFPESRLGDAFLGIDEYELVEEDKAHIAPEDW